MHEMGIANSVLDAVRAEAERYPGSHIYKVGVRIGELSGVAPDSLSFSFESLVIGTEMEPLALEIEYCSVRYECRKCGHSFPAGTEELPCPTCNSTDSFLAGGDELDIVYLEVEDGARTTGT
jgi:hydrogenase nickel incorporation protein HypA/HybF